MTIDGKKYWEEKSGYANSWNRIITGEDFMNYATMMESLLVEAYKLGYSDRTHKTPPFSDQDAKEYVLDHLSRV